MAYRTATEAREQVRRWRRGNPEKVKIQQRKASFLKRYGLTLSD